MHKIKLRKRHADQEYLVLEQRNSERQQLRLKKIQEKNQLKKTVSKCNTYFVSIFTNSHSIKAQLQTTDLTIFFENFPSSIQVLRGSNIFIIITFYIYYIVFV